LDVPKDRPTTRACLTETPVDHLLPVETILPTLAPVGLATLAAAAVNSLGLVPTEGGGTKVDTAGPGAIPTLGMEGLGTPGTPVAPVPDRPGARGHVHPSTTAMGNSATAVAEHLILTARVVDARVSTAGRTPVITVTTVLT